MPINDVESPDQSQFAGQSDTALFGGDATPRIVAIERSGDRSVRVFSRVSAELGRTSISVVEETFTPWMVVDPSVATTFESIAAVEQLRGPGQLSMRLRFDTWSRWLDAYRVIRELRVSAVAHPSAAEQYLVDSERGLFRGMEFADLVRLQIDIETLTLSASHPDAKIIIVTTTINGEAPTIFRADDQSEADMLRSVSQQIREIDPDVIEGHNLFNFDIPYLVERARVHGLSLGWGRDGSPIRLGAELRFKAGPRTVPYQSAHVYGRHLVDTYQQIQRYDAAGNLESYALKPAVEALGMTRGERVFVPGDEIATAWRVDREQLVKYAIDDVRDVNTLSELALPTEFYQTQILPRSLQSVAVGGPGEKINDLITRAYLNAGASIPSPRPSRGYPGGYAEVRHTGAFSPIVKCDVESLYPAIMLSQSIGPESDHLGVFLPMLETLTRRRIAAKRNEQRSSGAERARWLGIQSSFKVLINSFYGYLGYSRGYFNDYGAAERVTLRGQDIVQTIVSELERRGATAIEVDTDGVFFMPPDDVRSHDDELRLIDDVSTALDAAIRLAHDGRYRGMLSLKLKNYALLDYDGRVVLKGSSLRSRRDEPFLRRFIRDAVPRFLEPGGHGNLRDFYLDVAQMIVDGRLPIEDFARTETITDQTFRSDANRRLAQAVGEERVGERILVYQRADGSLARADAYADDEDRTYLLRRLRDMAERFRPVFDSDAEFEHTFPALTLRTDLEALRGARLARQLDLFSLDPNPASD